MVAAGNIRNAENTSPRNLLVSAPLAMGGRGNVYLFAGGFTNPDTLNTSDEFQRLISDLH